METSKSGKGGLKSDVAEIVLVGLMYVYLQCQKQREKGPEKYFY